MTRRQRFRKSRRGARRKPARSASLGDAPRNLQNPTNDMGATDGSREATTPRHRRPGRGAAIRRLIVAGLLLGPALGLVFGPWVASDRLPLYEATILWQGEAPGPADWPRPAARGESAVTRKHGARTLLVARAPSAAGAEGLALELALPRLSRSPELVAARDGRRDAWCEALVGGPAATLTRAGDCAARLRGWAEAWRAVAAGPVPGAESADHGRAPAGRAHPFRVDNEVAQRALALDPPGLTGALEREARIARAALLARIGSLPSGQREVAIGSWRRASGRRAAELDTMAGALRMPRIERDLIASAAAVHALDAEPRIPDPGVILVLAASGAEPAAARPLVATWVLFAAAGAALALLLTAPLAGSVLRKRRARYEEAMRRYQDLGNTFAALPPPAVAGIEARLQIVSGSHPRRVARVVRELTARFVAAGERVLVVDGGRHLRLHDGFGANSKLGFQECMREELPLLGVLQSGGLPGLHVLAHGSPSRLRSWLPLRRLLDQARPYFSRVVLALDSHVPRQTGEALAGRLTDGWWAGSDARKSRDARRLSTRVGIALQTIEAQAAEHATVADLVEELRRGARRDASPAPATAEAPMPAEATMPAEAPVQAAAEAVAPDEAAATAAFREIALLAEEMAPAPASIETATIPAMTPAPAPAVAEEAAVIPAPAPAETPVVAETASAPVEAAAPAPPIPEPPDLETLMEEVLREALRAPSRAPGLPVVDAPEEMPSPEAAPTPEAAPEAANSAPVRAEALRPPSLQGDPPPSLLPAPGVASAPASSESAGEPVVLESDPEVRERLRFLIWMRRLRDKNRGEVTHAG
jgi:hypothetical protein